ncbi:hypothetical protein ACFXA3_17355 [Streptomyces sp. NPDC059456]|uniref:hypothetical protein n=1 Tax=Streptomyces sp. NPDC059456 TaxID=3346838 RepID=UPI0036CA7D16
MRSEIGMGLFILGMVGLLIGSRGERGWGNWDRRQRIICSVSLVVAFTGLALSG